MIVLFRRFELDKGATSLGINAYDDFPDNTTGTIPGPPTLYVQDDFGLRSTKITTKWGNIEKVLRLAPELRPLPLGIPKDVLVVNFTSAAGYEFERDYPRQAANYINPRLNTYLKAHNQGRFGIVPRDFEADADDTNTLLAHANVPYNVVYYFFLEQRGLVVDVEDYSTQDGARLIAYQRTQAGPPNQVWQFVLSDTPPYFFIASKLGTGDGRMRVIEMDGTDTTSAPRLLARVIARGKVPGPESQLWMLVPSDGTGRNFFITNKVRKDAVITKGPSENGQRAPLLLARRETPAKDTQIWALLKAP